MLSVEDCVSVVNGNLTSVLDEIKFIQLVNNGIGDMRETSKYRAECFDKMLNNLSIKESEFIQIALELYLDKANSMIIKSFPVVQRAYDQWMVKGNQEQKRREKIASSFGTDFVSDLTEKVKSFKDIYISNQSDNLFVAYKMLYSHNRFNPYTEEQIKEKANKDAIDSWPYWAEGEINGILNILLRYDIGECKSFELKVDLNKIKVEGCVKGTKKDLSFYTIFAGGYNIQKLHMRTLIRD